MKKFFLLLFCCFSLMLFSQGKVNTKKINWISLEKAEKFAKKYNQKIFIYFYKPNCEYCERMKNETISDPEIIKLINTHFIAVKINGYSKDTIEYNNKIYGNQQPRSSGRFDFRHDFFFEYGQSKNRLTSPTILLINGDYEKLAVLPGFRPKIQLKRELIKYIK